MRIPCRHPVPVRVPGPRPGTDRVLLRALETPAEMGVAPSGEPTRDRRTYCVTDQSVTTRYAFRGRLWAVVTAAMAGVRDGGGRPATPDEVAACLAHPGAALHGLVDPGTALCPSGFPGECGPSRGADVPDGILATQFHDITDAARAALVRHVADNLLTDGSVVLSARSAPVLAPHAGTENFLLPEVPATLSGGPVFGMARLMRIARYTSALPRRDNFKLHHMVPAMERSLGDLPRDDGDLRLFANGGPPAVLHLLRLAEPRVRRDGGDPAILAARAASLTRLADLGSIGAIGPDGYRESFELVDAALRTLSAALPEGSATPRQRTLSAYVGRVAMHAVPMPAVPAEDADHLASLGPGL